MRLGARDVVLTRNASDALKLLERSAGHEPRSIARRARSLRATLLADCLHGEVVPGSRIPRPLVATHGVQNLYVEDLPAFWRLLYTIVRRGGQRYVVVVELVDHRQYDRWFGFRGR